MQDSNGGLYLFNLFDLFSTFHPLTNVSPMWVICSSVCSCGPPVIIWPLDLAHAWAYWLSEKSEPVGGCWRLSVQHVWASFMPQSTTGQGMPSWNARDYSSRLKMISYNLHPTKWVNTMLNVHNAKWLAVCSIPAMAKPCKRHVRGVTRNGTADSVAASFLWDSASLPSAFFTNPTPSLPLTPAGSFSCLFLPPPLLCLAATQTKKRVPSLLISSPMVADATPF